jgi:hypothetical protein
MLWRIINTLVFSFSFSNRPVSLRSHNFCNHMNPIMSIRIFFYCLHSKFLRVLDSFSYSSSAVVVVTARCNILVSPLVLRNGRSFAEVARMWPSVSEQNMVPKWHLCYANCEVRSDWERSWSWCRCRCIIRHFRCSIT